MNIIKARNILTRISKLYNLDFCEKFGYYEGNAYNDNKGNTLPNYMYMDGCVYGLKYIDGCFNPYLVELDKSKFGLVFIENSVKIDGVVKVDSNKAYEFYNNKFGSLFSMV